MGRIRISVQVLAWSDPNDLLRDQVKTRQENYRTWLEPCDEEVTINELAERIENRFPKIHAGKG